LDSLDELDDVDFTFADEGGGLLLLALRPGANPARVVAKAQGLIEQKVTDRIGVWIPTPSVVQIQETQPVRRNKKVVAAVVPADVPPPAESGSWLSPFLLAVLMLVGLPLFCWWRRVFLAKLFCRVVFGPSRSTATR
jgi:hypothetical protein